LSTTLDDSALADAEELVRRDCLSCHNNGTNNAPLFGDDEEWSRRLTQRDGLENLVDSAINGLGLMPAFGQRFSAEQLRGAVLFLSGQITTTDTGQPPSGELQPMDDFDLDGVANEDDNCPRVSNPNQDDADDDEIGDACEDNADLDGDGFTIALDDDDSNAQRIPGRGGELALTNTPYFLSEQPLALGQVAQAAADAVNNQSAGVLVSDEDFISAAERVYLGVTPMLEPQLGSALDIISLRLRQVPFSGSQLVVDLVASLPLGATMRSYQPLEGSWSGFVVSGVDQLASAQQVDGTCPATDSPNYTSNLGPGLDCLLITVTDGGPNDADGLSDGSVDLILRIAQPLGDTNPNSPNIADPEPDRGGGGATSLLWLMFYASLIYLRRCQQKIRSLR